MAPFLLAPMPSLSHHISIIIGGCTQEHMGRIDAGRVIAARTVMANEKTVGDRSSEQRPSDAVRGCDFAPQVEVPVSTGECARPYPASTLAARFIHLLPEALFRCNLVVRDFTLTSTGAVVTLLRGYAQKYLAAYRASALCCADRRAVTGGKMPVNKADWLTFNPALCSIRPIRNRGGKSTSTLTKFRGILYNNHAIASSKVIDEPGTPQTLPGLSIPNYTTLGATNG